MTVSGPTPLARTLNRGAFARGTRPRHAAARPGAPGGVHAAVGERVLSVGGIINPISARYLVRGIEEAADEGDAAVLIELDTPGGLLDATQEMTGAMLSARVPVIVYVTPGRHARGFGRPSVSATNSPPARGLRARPHSHRFPADSIRGFFAVCAVGFADSLAHVAHPSGHHLDSPHRGDGLVPVAGRERWAIVGGGLAGRLLDGGDLGRRSGFAGASVRWARFLSGGPVQRRCQGGPVI